MKPRSTSPGRPGSRPLAIAVLGAAAVAAVIALALAGGAAAPPSSGAVTAGPGPGSLLAARGTGSGGGGTTLTVESAASGGGAEEGFTPGARGPGEPAAAPALVAGRGGRLAEAPSGLAGRAATRRGSPAEVPWERVRVFARVSELGSLKRDVASGLSAARERLEQCFAEERRALAAGRGPPFDPADPPTGPAILVLDLQTRSGGLDVVSANVESLGTSTPELATCAVQLLTGYAIDAPAASKGRRFRLLHTLQ